MKPKVTDLKGITRDLLVGGPYKRISRRHADSASQEFAIGELYFMLWYADQDDQADQSGLFLVPESLVFIGKNLEGDEQIETWYFQDTKSYCAYGAYPNNAETGLGPDEYYGRLHALHQDDLFQIVDCRGLMEALAECVERRVKSGSGTR